MERVGKFMGAAIRENRLESRLAQSGADPKSGESLRRRVPWRLLGAATITAILPMGCAAGERSPGFTTGGGPTTFTTGQEGTIDGGAGGDTSGDDDGETGGEDDGGIESAGDGDGDGDEPEYLWYSVRTDLHRFSIDRATGLVLASDTFPLVDGGGGFSGDGAASLTQLSAHGGGGLLGARLSGGKTQIFRVPVPSAAANPGVSIVVDVLGEVPGSVDVEALYTDCLGRVYLMDTGSDTTSAAGNRLLRFSGDYLAGDLQFDVITDLSTSSVSDLDDLGPGISASGAITDSVGLAVDSGTVHEIDYLTGTGAPLGSAGTFGIHALSGDYYDDAVARLYVLDESGGLFLVEQPAFTVVGPLASGPAWGGGTSGLAGRLGECQSGIP